MLETETSHENFSDTIKIYWNFFQLIPSKRDNSENSV